MRWYLQSRKSRTGKPTRAVEEKACERATTMVTMTEKNATTEWSENEGTSVMVSWYNDDDEVEREEKQNKSGEAQEVFHKGGGGSKKPK